MKAVELVFICFSLFGACLVGLPLAISNRPVLVPGVPALVLCLFVVGTVIVATLAALTRDVESAPPLRARAVPGPPALGPLKWRDRWFRRELAHARPDTHASTKRGFHG